MTRVALLSDIHGNLIALEAVMADLGRQGSFDQIIVAGDLVWAGPWPAEVVDLLRTHGRGIIAVQGNTDAFFRRLPGEPPPGKRESRFAEQLSWMVDQLGPARRSYLESLPFSHRIALQPGEDLLVVHANPADLDRPILPAASVEQLDSLLTDGLRLSASDRRECRAEGPDWRALAFGHVHVPFIRPWRGRMLVDVASAGLPMDGDPRAAYAILAWDGATWSAEHRRVPYEVPVVAHRMRTGGMPRGKHFAERLANASYSVRAVAAGAERRPPKIVSVSEEQNVMA